MEGNTHLFSLKCNFFKKDFVNQRNSTPIYNDARQVVAENLPDLMENLWKIIIDCKQLQREVIVEGDSVAWSPVDPGADNNQIDKFAQIFDVKGRRNYTPSSITMDLLTSLRSKEVHVIVFVYSRNVSTHGTFSIVKKTLLDPAVKDRSDAVANLVIDNLIAKLKEYQSHKYVALQPIAWRMWATYVGSKPSLTQDQLLMDPPPYQVSEFFRSIPTTEAEILTNAQKGLRVARNVNGIQRGNLRGIRERVQRLQATIDSCTRELGDLITHLDCLEQMSEREDSLLQDMDSAIRPEESSFSIEVAQLVTDCEDVDHMEVL